MTAVENRPSSGNSGKSTDGTGMKRDIGLVGLLFAGVGSIIGSGWLFGALNASQIAGPAAIFSWVIGAVMILLIGLCFAELGAMFPLTGGAIRFPHLSFGSFASYTMGWINWVAAATVAPIEVEGALQYGTKYADFTTKHMPKGAAEPVYTLTGLGYGVAVVAMALFVVVNYFGVRWFARVNTIAVWWKLAVITLVIFAFLLTEFHGSNFTSHGFAPQGTHGMLTAIATGGITFSFLGFRQGVELAGESNNPKRNVPIAVLGSVLVTGVIYVLLQVAFLGAVDPKDLSKGWSKLDFANSFGPLAAIATLLGLGWLATILYIDAIISPADTGLVYTTVTGRITYAMSKNRNAPQALGKTTSRGVPLVSLIVTFFVGLIVFLPFPSWQQLVGFITSATVLSFGSGPIVLAAMRRQIPDYERPFKLPFGDLIPFLGFYSANMIVFWAGWDVDWKLFATVALGFVLLAAFHLIGGGTKGKNGDQGGMPALEWRSGATWSLPWLGGLCLISYLGDYPVQKMAAGNTSSITYGPDFLVVLGLSVIVYLLAMKFRLPKERVEENIEETEAEAAEEEKELGAAP